MKFSEIQKGDIKSFGNMIIFGLNETDKLLLLPEKKILRTDHLLLDVEVIDSDKDDIKKALVQVDHQNDGISALYQMFLETELNL